MNISHCPRCGYPLVKGSDGKWLCFCLADPKGFQKKQALLNKQNAQQSVQRIGLLARLSKWFGAIANR